MSEVGGKGSSGSDAAAAKPPPSGQAAVSWDAFLSTYLPALVLAIGTGIALPAIPTLAKTYAISFGMASGIVTSFVLGNVFGTIPSGWLIDRFGNRIVLISAPLITSVTSFAIFFSDNFTELLILRFLTGMAAQMWQMARLAAISYGAAPSQRGRLVSWMFGMDSTGRLAGPIIGGFIAASWGPRAPFLVFAALALIALVPTSTFGKDTPRQDRGDKKTARTMTLREVIMPRLVYFGVALFAGMTRGPLNADLLHLYAAFAYNLGPAQIGYLATAASCLSLPIGFTGGWIMDRFGRKRTMVPGFTGVTIAMALLAVSAFAHLSLAWYVGLFLLGVATQALTGGSVQTVGADVAPAEARGTFLGIWRFTGQGGVALGPIVFALVADTVDYGTAFLFTSSCAAVVAFLLIRYVPETGRQSD
ncbi:MAG TPA: MFS transporter [Stellaceae bacterium]|jgi:MFS family permease